MESQVSFTRRNRGKLVRRCADLLLSVLLLVVLSVVGGVVGLLSVGTRLRIGTLSTTTPLPCAILTAVAAVSLRRPIALVLRWVVRLPNLWTTPGRNVRAACRDVVSCTSTSPRTTSTISAWPLSTLTKLCHQASVFRVKASFGQTSGWARDRRRGSVGIPVNLTVACHVPSASAHTTDDVSSEVALFGAVIFAMTKTTTVLTNLVLIVTKGTIQRGQLAELIALVIVLTFGSGSGLNGCQPKIFSSKRV